MKKVNWVQWSRQSSALITMKGETTHFLLSCLSICLSIWLDFTLTSTFSSSHFFIFHSLSLFTFFFLFFCSSNNNILFLSLFSLSTTTTLCLTFPLSIMFREDDLMTFSSFLSTFYKSWHNSSNNSTTRANTFMHLRFISLIK